MISIKKALFLAVAVTLLAWSGAAQEPVPAGRAVGTIKAITGLNIVLTTDAGAELNVMVQGQTRIVRIAPTQKDLKDATPVLLQDLKPGDRVLVRGTASPESKTIAAASIILMKAEDVVQKHERERQDWEKRGVGGLVSAVDVAGGTVQIKTTGFTGSHAVMVRTTKDTIVRRYAPDSPHFDDAVRATLDQVKPGDQLRARGTRNADGSELAAEEVVAGTFRNIAGVVISTDAAANTITLTDLAIKKPVVVKLSSDSLLHKMPEMLAQRLAFIAKGAAAGGEGTAPAGGPREGGQRSATMQGPAAGQRPGGFSRNGAAPDLAQMLANMPVVTVSELKKGDALMIVATAPLGAGQPTIITLLAGVEPILAASPNNGAAMLLSPWNLGGGGGGGEGGPPN